MQTRCIREIPGHCNSMAGRKVFDSCGVIHRENSINSVAGNDRHKRLHRALLLDFNTCTDLRGVEV